jgi:pilus assembly protein CpaF
VSILNGNRAEVVANLAAQARVRLAGVPSAPTGAAERADLVADTARQTVETFQAERIEAGQATLDEIEERDLAAAVIAKLHGTAGLTALMADESIEDIWYQGCDHGFVHYADGRQETASPICDSDAEMIEMIRALVGDTGAQGEEQERRFDQASPIVDKRLPNGARLHAVMGVSPRPSVAVRLHRLLRVAFAELRAGGMFVEDVESFITALVAARANLVICGRTGSGKTTFLRAMCSLLDAFERLVTIEDTWELDLHRDPAHRNVVALQAREANIEGAGAISLATLFRSALRMNPSRVLVGEVRGDEIVPMLHAMNQGNDGSLSTIHASSSAGAFSKMMLYGAASPERLDRAAMAQLIADGVDFVIHLGVRDGKRTVESIREVAGSDGETVLSNEIFRSGPDGRAEPHVPPTEAWTDRLDALGWVRPEAWGRW